jgi:hypothetical protein
LRHGYEITAVALSPDGKTALTAATVFQPENPKRTRSEANLKKLGSATGRYVDKHKTFPASANFDKSGKPLLSWRVHLLPYLEQDHLYRQFKLDEPWDSPTNKKLVAKMPAVYASPLNKLAESGKTTYLAVTGKDSMFEGQKGVRLIDVVDGTTNTIMVVEANEKKAVFWTEPEDFPISTKHPVAGLVNEEIQGFLVLFADQTIQLLPASTPSEKLHDFFTRNGQEPPWSGIDQSNPWQEIARWDWATGKMTAAPWKIPEPERIVRVQICPDGETVLAVNGGQNVFLCNLTRGSPISRTSTVPAASVRIDPDAHFIAESRFDTVGLFPVPALSQEIRKWTFQAGITALEFVPGGKRLFTATMDGKCRFWELATGRDTGGLVLPKGYANNAAFPPDGNAVLLCTSEGTARLWDAETGLPLGPELPCKGPGPSSAAFNKSGTYFLLQDNGGTRLYHTPVPLAGKVEQLVLWVQVLTGTELDAEGRLQILTLEQWNERRQRLERMGGVPHSP